MSDRLQGMIRSLLGLYSQISSKLIDSRRQWLRSSRSRRDALQMEALLGEHIDRTAPTSTQNGRSAAQDPAEKPGSVSVSTASLLSGGGGSNRPGVGVFQALSNHFRQHSSNAHGEPMLRDKMRANTLDHINKALVLAKQGNATGARIHAGLASSAMHTAGKYMTDEEYGQFHDEVEKRLQVTHRMETEPNA